MLKHIPNLITLANLFFGCLATVAVLYGEYGLTFWLVALAIFADYIDGAVARALKVSSELGKQLDSLADMVSFGVVPGAILYRLIFSATGCTLESVCWAAVPGFIVSVAAGLRLGRFNLDARQSEAFIGLPTPSLTMFSLGLLMIHEYDAFGAGFLLDKTWLLYLLVGLLSYILNAPLHMFSLKFKSFGWKDNEVRYSFMVLALVLLVVWKGAALALIILLYMLISAILHFFSKKIN